MSRNAPCPCGSGRKFKRCCADAVANPALTARKHDRVGARIQAWALEHRRADMQAALEEITAGHEDVVLGDLDLQLIASFMHNDRELPGGGTAAQRYAARRDLHPDGSDIAARIAAARLGLVRVLRVMPGRWIELHDLTGGDDLVRVISHDDSRSARPDAVLVGRHRGGAVAVVGGWRFMRLAAAGWGVAARGREHEGDLARRGVHRRGKASGLVPQTERIAVALE